MGDNDKTQQPRLVVPGADPRAKMYDKIAQVQKGLIEAKWRARTQNMELQVGVDVIIHHQEAIHFLAGEVLRLTAIVEALPQALEDASKALEGNEPPEAEG